MSNEEFLQPRWKVIGEWPYMPKHIKVGIILTNPLQFNWAKFPHLFKEIFWWEERKVEDMPGYLKVSSGKIFKVTNHFVGNQKQMAQLNAAHGQIWYPYNLSKISTEQEYLTLQTKVL